MKFKLPLLCCTLLLCSCNPPVYQSDVEELEALHHSQQFQLIELQERIEDLEAKNEVIGEGLISHLENHNE